MVRSMMANRMARLAMAPAGAATAIATTSMLLVGEKSTATATNRLAAKSMNQVGLVASRLWMQPQLSFSTKVASAAAEETKKVAADAVSKRTSTTIAAAAIQPPPAQKSLSFLQWYEKHLQARPVQTKMLTGSLLWGIGDWVAQAVPSLMFSDDDNNNATHTTMPPYDFARTGRAVLFGFAFHAPASHFHFNFLEWLTIRSNVTGLGIPVFKAFMEQFVYWSWLSNSLYHGAMGAMQGQSPKQVYDRVADNIWETQKAQWVFWIPIQLINFRFTPVRHQLNVVLVTSIVWTALLSAWYPPEAEEQESKQEPNKEATA